MAAPVLVSALSSVHAGVRIVENEKRKMRRGEQRMLKEKGGEVRKKIVLIDENPDVGLFNALQQEGYEVVTCESPQKAWGLVHLFRPHFVIVHFHRPSIRDVAQLQECRALAAGAPVIIATSVPGYETIMKALEEGATAFLFLPIKPEAVRNMLEGLESSANR
jgi:DNA-binding NtrC family response regulator